MHNLHSAQIGFIEGVRTVVPTFSQVTWGIVADKWQSRKSVWLVTKICSTISLLTLALPIVFQSFGRILFVSIMTQLFVTNGLLDAYTLELLGKKNKLYYGRYRLYASLSWGLGSMAIGWVTDRFGFEPNFFLFAALGALMIILVAWCIPEAGRVSSSTEIYETAEEPLVDQEDNNQNGASPASLEYVNLTPDEEGTVKELFEVFVRPRTLIFLIEVIIMGAAMATVERLLFLYLVNDLEASTLLCGLSVGVNVLFELPIFWYASKLMAWFGHDGLMMLAMMCSSFRVYGYTLLSPSTKWAVLWLEILHGITFACFWITSTDISKILVHETTATRNSKSGYWGTTIPSSVNMLYSAVGSALGSILGGWAMHKYGSRPMYELTARIVFGTLIFHALGSIVCRVWLGSSLLPSGCNFNDDDDESDGEADDEGSEIVHG